MALEVPGEQHRIPGDSGRVGEPFFTLTFGSVDTAFDGDGAFRLRDGTSTFMG
jgi:hypothetical protein